MPELPEVETIVNALKNPLTIPFNPQKSHMSQPGIVGRVIQKGEILWKRSLTSPTVDEFVTQIKNKQVTAVSRRGKFILIHLEDLYLLIHLRMSGDIFVETLETTRNTLHDRMVLNFQDSTHLAFNDTRKFGRIWLTDNAEKITSGLGPEPFSNALDESAFYKKLQSSKRKIKPLLMDQSFLAGLGNIYTDESLFNARIHPNEISSALDPKQAGLLLRSIRKVLSDGIDRNGASIDWVYRGGDYQNHFEVYQRNGQICSRCGGTIQRIIVGQRGTHFCPICQPLKIVK